MSPKGLIFDCDGTLVDSMPTHLFAWQTALQELSVTFDGEDFDQYAGWPTLQFAAQVVSDFKLSLSAEELTKKKEAIFLEHIEQVARIDRVVAIAVSHMGRTPMAVATSALHKVCEQQLRQTGIYNLFSAIVAAEDVSHHKPAPDCYLLAAERLELHPGDCLAYEDTDTGILAAQRAEIPCIDVRTMLPAAAIE